MTPVEQSLVLEAALKFMLGGTIDSISPFSGGHINRSYLVSASTKGGIRRFLLQAINTSIFKSPFAVMDNIERVTSHLRGRLLRDGCTDVTRRVLELVRTVDGPLWFQSDSGFWRCYRFIENTRVELSVSNESQAFTAGHAFGTFLRQLDDFPAPPLHETIPRFHDTPSRVLDLRRVIEADRVGRVRESLSEIDCLLAHAVMADALTIPLAQGVLPCRVVHNDAKLSNVLLDTESGDAVCVTDFDTVMPGTALFDFGDMVRSMASHSAEDSTDLSSIRVDPGLFHALAYGYVAGAGGALTPVERSLLTTSGIVITYEQAVRFLTDWLDGDRYYGADYPRHNYDRARSQMALHAALLHDRDSLERRVAGLEIR